MRQIIVTGRLGADAEEKVSKQGNHYVTFRIANNEFGDNDKTYWFRVTSFENRHLKLVKHLTKGKPIIVQGKLDENLFQRANGEFEIGREIICSNIEFMNIGSNENCTNNADMNTTANTEKSVSSGSATKPEQVQMSPFNPQINTSQTEANAQSVDDDDLPF